MSTEPQHTCPSCDSELSGAMEFCPVCMLRQALGRGESTELALEHAVDPTPKLLSHRFEHYELVTGEDGKPVELGRGAMGVTYKAFDVDLHCPVTLKVINEKYIGDESARLRFLREARAAASVRHPNVASVFHLGRSGEDYFYAMEFIEGQTLEIFIKRSGPLAVKLALEITSQIAAGLAAINKQELVHRDIKPSNIMVSFEEGSAVTAKIIDLGLAEAIHERSSQSAPSIPRSFAGTPEYASPEQFAGIGVDIRSDLYSLGVTLWEMLTGYTLFGGSPAELMSKHLSAPLPLEQLKHVPQPVVALVESLLKKDPVHRPQNPFELRTMLDGVQVRLEHRVRDRLAYEDPGRFGDGKRKPHSALPPEPWDFAPFLRAKLKGFIGRQWLFREIEKWCAEGTQPAILLVGEPGIGKSSIIAALVDQNPEGTVLAYHFCRADTPATLEPAGFVRSIAAMFATRLEGYAAMLEGHTIVSALERADSDPASAFEAAILAPLHKLRQPEGVQYYILIDALDECLARTRRPTIAEVLATRLNLLPPWLRIVATTRSEARILSQLRGLRANILSARDPRNQEDVRYFIRCRLANSVLLDKAQGGDKPLAALEEHLLRSSAGNFLFTATVLDAVESGQLRFDQIEKLPPGLRSLYEVFFDRLFSDADMDFEPARQVLEVVAVAREPLIREQIAAATGLDPDGELIPILSRLASFVPASARHYALFHRSIFDWLTGWDTEEDRPFAGPYHVSLDRGQRRLAEWCWADYERGLKEGSLYSRRHLVAHLHEAGRDQDARGVLLDFKFLQAKLEATDVNALIADYDDFAEEADLRIIQSALRLSAHVLARDTRQLAGQLTGRLLGSSLPNIQAFLRQVAETISPWLRPLRPSLTPPGGPLIQTLEDHTNWVTAVAITPDGCHVVSGSHDRTVRVWDLENGHRLLTLEGHMGWVHAVAVTPDGRRAISGSGDHLLRIWDLEVGQLLHTLRGHTDWIAAVAATPDGRWAISGSGDHTLRVWDLENGQCARTLEGHTDTVSAVAIIPDRHRSISASYDRTLRVWDLENGQPLRTLKGHTDRVNAVVVTADGRRAVSASADQTLRVWDLESGQALCTLEGHTAEVNAVAVTPGGRHGISGSADHTLRVWDLESGQALRMLCGHTDWVNAVAVTPEGHHVVSGSADRTVRVWDLESRQSLRMPEDDTDGVTALVQLPDDRCALLNSHYHKLRVWSLESGKVVWMLEGHTDWITAVVVTPDGGHVVSGSADHALRIWDLKNGQMIRVLEGHTAPITALAITLNGRRAVSGSDDHTLRVWDLEGGRTIAVLENRTELVSVVAVAADACRIVWGSADGMLRRWDPESGKMICIVEGHADWVTALAVTPDGRRAVSASANGTLRVWELEDGKTVQMLKGHTDRVSAVGITPDGKRAISSSYDHTLRVWDLETGDYVAGFTADGPVLGFTVTRTGRTIIARDKSGGVHLLHLDIMN